MLPSFIIVYGNRAQGFHRVNFIKNIKNVIRSRYREIETDHNVHSSALSLLFRNVETQRPHKRLRHFRSRWIVPVEYMYIALLCCFNIEGNATSLASILLRTPREADRKEIRLHNWIGFPRRWYFAAIAIRSSRRPVSSSHTRNRSFLLHLIFAF